MKVYIAIANVMARLAKEGISKSRKNVQQGYQFRGIDDVYNTLASLLAEYKLVILPRVLHREVTERQTAKGGVLFYVVLDMEFDFVSAEDGTKHTIRTCGEAMDSADKATNKAMSAAYKYACLQTFCIPTEGDNDADYTTHGDIKPKTVAQIAIENDGGAPSEGELKRWASIADQFREAMNDDKDEYDIAKTLEEMSAKLVTERDKMGVWKMLDGKEKKAVREFQRIASTPRPTAGDYA